LLSNARETLIRLLDRHHREIVSAQMAVAERVAPDANPAEPSMGSKPASPVVTEVPKPVSKARRASYGSCVNPARRMPCSCDACVAHFCVCDQQMGDAGVAATGAWITHDPYHSLAVSMQSGFFPKFNDRRAIRVLPQV